MNVSINIFLLWTIFAFTIASARSNLRSDSSEDGVVDLIKGHGKARRNGESGSKGDETDRHEARNSTKKQCNCGVRRGSERIVGGVDAEINEFPWRCALFIRHKNGFKLFCGCSVLSETHIMTAAHCTNAVKGREVFVDAGDHDLTIPDETNNQVVKVSTVHQHPEYNTRTFDNDISILELETKLDIGGAVEPICLPYKFTGSDFAGTQIIASGWGTTSENGRTASILQKVEIPVLTTEECGGYFSKGQITENMLCTLSEGKDTCQGDSGSSIDLKDTETGQYYAIGVVSFGYGCARNDSPGVYTKVTKYLDFIESKTGDVLCKS